MDYAFFGAPADECVATFADRLSRTLQDAGHFEGREPLTGTNLVFSLVDTERPRPFRRHAQATYVVAVLRLHEEPDDFLRAAYLWLVRSLANLLIAVVGDPDRLSTYFLTLERGYYPVRAPWDTEEHMQEVIGRLTPLASSHLIVDNLFDEDLDRDLWQGGGALGELHRAGQALDGWNLLPAPFPIQEVLPPKDYRHLQRLYQLGGLSYGNLSRRHRGGRFWMSASGVNKANLSVVGRDVLMVKDFDDRRQAMRLSVPPGVQPRRVSVDAIEHHMIYREHPKVEAIIHVHAWMDGVRSTEINYPCGTIELAQAVAAVIREAEDPAHAVVGLRNHGLTITGLSLDDILERVDGRIVPQVPMS